MTEAPPSAAQDLERRGDALLAAGDARGALDAYGAAARAAPELGRLEAKRGSALMALGDYPAAVAAFLAARERLPNAPAVFSNLGAALMADGRPDEALAAPRRAVELRPDYAVGHYNLARALAAGGDLKGALAAFSAACACDPKSAAARIGLGQTQIDLRDIEAARASFEAALAIDPRSADALMNLGYLAQRCHDLFTAARRYEEAIAVDPRHWRAASNLAGVYLKLGRLADSRELRLKAMALAPGHLSVRSDYLFSLDFDAGLAPAEIFAQHRAFASIMPSAPARPAAPRRPAGRIRVGYISADFRIHACAYFLLPLLRAHDPAKVELICYGNSAIEDGLTAAFKAVAQRWRTIHALDDARAAAAIAADEVDILVDCAGHTDGNRLGVFARRPARHAVSWLGYGNTTGLAAIGYRFTDAVLDPESEQNAFATEKLVRLRSGFMTYDPLEPLPALTPPPFRTNGFITFGSFNDLGKMNAGIIGLWCRVLHAVPGSRLRVKDRHLDYADIRAMLAAMFAANGIEADRISFAGFSPDRRSHLAAMGDVDICFDTHPYGGNTTTCDTASMGVPTVTLYGNRYTARQSASILTRLGLEALIARSPEAYVDTAVDLARDKTRLAALRSGLRASVAASAIGNPRLLAEDMEAAYAAIVEGRL